MPTIIHQLTIHAPRERVFDAVATPAGLDAWWTWDAAGEVALGQEVSLGFGPGYVWSGQVVAYEAPSALELVISADDADWAGTRLRFELRTVPSGTELRLLHAGWVMMNDHFARTNTCWAMYLRLLRRFVETGERVPYAERLAA